uniref:Uncharacterized protein n=1 Tax=Cacopsylla melanoneura TaxID=428564 RepID=A0A8D8USX7_9HEMI
MDVYWSHYAKVMEFNRQRILLQNPNINMSCYDIPTRLRTNTIYNRTPPSPQHQCNVFTAPISRRVHSHKHNVKEKHQRKHKKAQPVVKSEAMDPTETDNSSRLEFVIDDGFMKFLEISMEHKLKRKKQLQAEKHREQLKQEEELAKGTHLMGVKHSQRKQFKSQLYGKEADKIMAMENAMDASLNQQKDINNPVFWPNIALNLKF